ncbi:ABC transporter ATP-binding protein [Halalkalibacter hemicellulosilyticus]|uniref:ABC transporter ATP-binding protein n=1 Tax=Halalkalibacter hemicellulosilyticusJCM 9152 TaxID=1236971 RepID=W4QC46_9BACI|nr:ABC transporter ATP-binding protein [Halalkalibacter hemicellulosilyticus]GAE29605.1 ABC transporter ATP-binding protein [Halalkalibacter hemicellulosilyticusJCM 9152]
MKLVFDNVAKKFKDTWAVEPFSAELTEGIYALLGPNGSGKTTLMRMIAHILKPTSGRILLDGKDISLLDEKYRDLLGYLPQDFGMYPHFTAERFLNYFASLKGLDKQETKEKVTEVLKLVNLEESRKKKVRTFSGGMKRRLGIAQALLNDPRIVVVDEPTAGLDPKERIRFRNLLSDISHERIVLLSTHIVSDIEYIANEIFIMEKGSLKQRSNVDGLLAEMDGKVWKVLMKQEELDSIQTHYKVGNIQRKEHEVEVRIVSDVQPFHHAKVVPPTLEDVYLYHFYEEDQENV